MDAFRKWEYFYDYLNKSYLERQGLPWFVWWLRFCNSIARAVGSIPGWGLSHAAWYSAPPLQKRRKTRARLKL